MNLASPSRIYSQRFTRRSSHHSQRFTCRPFTTPHSPAIRNASLTDRSTIRDASLTGRSIVRDASLVGRLWWCSLSHRRRFTSPHRCRFTVHNASVLRRLFVMIQSFAPSAMLPTTIHSFAPSAMLPTTLRLLPSRRLFAFHTQTYNGYFFFSFWVNFCLMILLPFGIFA